MNQFIKLVVLFYLIMLAWVVAHYLAMKTLVAGERVVSSVQAASQNKRSFATINATCRERVVRLRNKV